MSSIVSLFSALKTRIISSVSDPFSTPDPTNPPLVRAAALPAIRQANQQTRGSCCRHRPRLVEKSIEHEALSRSLREAEIQNLKQTENELTQYAADLREELASMHHRLQAQENEIAQLKSAAAQPSPAKTPIPTPDGGQFDCDRVHVLGRRGKEVSFEEERWREIQDAEEADEAIELSSLSSREADQRPLDSASLEQIQEQLRTIHEEMENLQNDNTNLTELAKLYEDKIAKLESTGWRADMLKEKQELLEQIEFLKDEITELNEKNSDLADVSDRVVEENTNLRKSMQAWEARRKENLRKLRQQEMDEKDARNRPFRHATSLSTPAQVDPSPTLSSSSTQPRDTVSWINQLLSDVPRIVPDREQN